MADPSIHHPNYEGTARERGRGRHKPTLKAKRHLTQNTYFICLTMVLLPDSPAPVKQKKKEKNDASIRIVGARFTRTNGTCKILLYLLLLLIGGGVMQESANRCIMLHDSRGGNVWRRSRVASSSLPSRSNFTSFAAVIPSSFRFFSIALLLSKAALSSALSVHPMVRRPSALLFLQNIRS